MTVIDRSTRERIPRLRLNIDDNDYFRSRLASDSPILDATKPSHILLNSAFASASTQVQNIVATHDEKNHGDVLNRWIDFIASRALVILLRVQSEANAYRMFETLNDRGLRTSQADLVKNYLFGRAGDRIAEVQNNWTLMRGALESMEKDDITIVFLRNALTIMRGFVREAQVYEITQTRANAPQPVVEFSQILAQLSTTYVAIHSSEHERWNGHTREARRAVEVLNLFGIRPMRPLVLAIGHKFEEPETAERALKRLVSLGVRLMITGSTRTGTIEEGLAAVAYRVFDGEIADAGTLHAALQSVTPRDEEFRVRFETATVSNRKLGRYYLRSLEMAACGEEEPWHIPNDDSAVITLEHILPEKPEGNWPQFDEEQVRLCWRRIGNLALLRSGENSNLKSDKFEDKKVVYAQAPYTLTSELRELDDWTLENIAERQKGLGQYALIAWPYNIC